MTDLNSMPPPPSVTGVLLERSNSRVLIKARVSLIAGTSKYKVDVWDDHTNQGVGHLETMDAVDSLMTLGLRLAVAHPEEVVGPLHEVKETMEGAARGLERQAAKLYAYGPGATTTMGLDPEFGEITITQTLPAHPKKDSQ